MTLREELDARLAEFDQRSAAARDRRDAVLLRWERRESAARPAFGARLRSRFRRSEPRGG